MTEETPRPVDGVVAPLAVTPPPAVPTTPLPAPGQKSGRYSKLFMGLFIAAAVVYSLPALVLIAMFPRPDGGMSEVKNAATIIYGAGSILWLFFGLLGAMRISGVKDRPRLKFFAALRLAAMVIPPMLIGGASAALINVPPKLVLEIVSPASSSDLIAPVTVTFGMSTALTIFRQQKLTPLKYEWNFGVDGKAVQETFDPQSTFVFTKSGVFTVSAVVTMTNNQTKVVSRRVVIPRASFGVQPITPIIDEPVTFSIDHLFPKGGDDKAPKLLKAKWDFDGDSVFDVETDKAVATTIYHKLGLESVSVTMTMTNQTQSTLQRIIEVVKPPEQPFPITLETEPQTLLGPPPFGVIFTLKTKEPIANATWDFGNKKSGEGLRVAQIYTTVGNYTVTVAARSQSGAIAKLSKMVRVTNPLDVRDLTFEGTPEVKSFTIEGQVPLTIDITPVTSMPLISFSWDAPDASEVLGTEKNFHAVYRDEGRYIVDLIGMDPDQNVYRRRITVNATAPKSTVAFSMDPQAPTAPATVVFDASDTYIPTDEEITGFEWDFGDGGGAYGGRTEYSGSRIEHRFDNEGTYVITLTVRTTAGKTYSGNQTLVVRAPIVDACFLASRTSGKAPLGVRFDTECATGEFVSWTWDFGDKAQSDQQNPTHVFTEPGEYKVTLTAVTADGTRSVKRTTISVTP